MNGPVQCRAIFLRRNRARARPIHRIARSTPAAHEPSAGSSLGSNLGILICIKVRRHARGDMFFMFAESPVCPNCARAMVPASEPDALAPGLCVYRCDPCGTLFSEVLRFGKPAPDRAMVLNFEADTARH
jgi:hypothetical protein